MFWRRRPATSSLPDYGQRYIEHIMAEYKTAKLTAPIPSHVQSILDTYAQSPATVTWADLCMIEKSLLGLQPFPIVKRRAWSLRDKYREVAGPAEYNAYIASHPPNESEKDVDQAEVRADLARVLDSLHWSYALLPIREGLRGYIINRLALRVFLFGLVSALLAWLSLRYDERLIATLIVVGFAGCLGGFVSMQQRIGQVPSDGDPLPGILQLNIARTTLYLAPASGTIFAVLLYFIFVAGLLKGSIFPTIDDPLTFHWHVNGNKPVTVGVPEYDGKEYALLIVWSFIAGFAERFVPDILNRLIARADTAQTPPPSPAPPFASSPPAGAAAPAAGGDRLWSPPR